MFKKQGWLCLCHTAEDYPFAEDNFYLFIYLNLFFIFSEDHF